MNVQFYAYIIFQDIHAFQYAHFVIPFY